MKNLIIFSLLFIAISGSSQNTGFGTQAPLDFVSIGSNSQLRVDSFGNIRRINNVPYSFPASQGGSATVLTNSGSGGLTWGNIPAISITGNSPITVTGTYPNLTIGYSGSSGGGVSGSGSSNYIPLWNGSTSLGNSPIYLTSSGQLAIGTTTPRSVNKFEVLTSGYDAVNGITNGSNNGVYGESNGSYGSGIYGRNLSSTGTGTFGGGNGLTASNILLLTIGSGGAFSGTQYGIAGFSTINSTGIYRAGGYFQTYNGNSYAYVGAINSSNTVRKIEGNGTVNTTVKNVKGELVVLSAPEAPENLFQDFGTGRLINGIVHIDLDPNLVKNIIVDSLHPLRVLVQAEGDCNGIFVTNKLQNGFDVKELQQGNSNVSFTWFVTANRADEVLSDGTISRYSIERFAPAMGPQHTDRSRKE